MNEFIRQRKILEREIHLWIGKYQVNIAIFNILLIVLFLLRSVGYFHPYFPITIHIIVLASVLLSMYLLGATSSSLITVSLIFLISSAMLKIVGINVWAERTAMYGFEIYSFAVIREFMSVVKR